MKILNLYAGIGGNRKLWGDEHEVVAVEYDEKIAQIYKDLFPNDTVIIGDAHQYLLDHYQEFDFIWSSPPCQTHTTMQFLRVRGYGDKPKFPDMKLYEEIVFLQQYAGDIKWAVENVKPYYGYLIEPTVVLQRHPIWSNFAIEAKEFSTDRLRSAQIPELQARYGYDLSAYRLPNKRQVLRNVVNPELGKYVFDELRRHSM